MPLEIAFGLGDASTFADPMLTAAIARDCLERSPRALRVVRVAGARAPMRISLAGGGTDVPPFVRGVVGRVVSAAIDLHVRVTVEPFDRGWIRLEGAWGQADAEARGGAVPRVASFTRRAEEPASTDVAFRMLEVVREHVGVTEGVHIVVESDLTPGTGLGGSAAAAVALLGAFRGAMGLTVDPLAIAAEAAHLERHVLGLRCGLQDQLCAAAGGLLDLRFSTEGFDVAPIPAAPSLVRDLTAGLMLIDTRVRRVSGEILEVATPACAKDLHADLVAAADDTARALRLGSLPLVLAGMRRSASAKLRRGGPSALPWEQVRHLSRLGAVVLRACGAGGGGHVLVWADPSRQADILQAIEPSIVRRPRLGVPGLLVSEG